jgi:acyl-CoA thioesterase I
LSKPIGPRAYAANLGSRPVLVCAGDSLTRGVMSARWVRKDAAAMAPAVETVNAGVSGNLAWNLLARLDDVIACRPAVVTVLIGTNDAYSQVSEKHMDRYVRAQGLPRRPDPGWYEENLERIVERLTTETSAAVALMSLPPIGDALAGGWHELISQFNAIIAAVAARTGVPVLPVHEQIAGLIEQAPAKVWDGSRILMASAAIQRLLLRRSLDAISRSHGFATTTDAIHLNDRAAERIAALVERFASDATQPGASSS